MIVWVPEAMDLFETAVVSEEEIVVLSDSMMLSVEAALALIVMETDWPATAEAEDAVIEFAVDVLLVPDNNSRGSRLSVALGALDEGQLISKEVNRVPNKIRIEVFILIVLHFSLLTLSLENNIAGSKKYSRLFLIFF